MKLYVNFIKRIMDFSMAFVALVLFSPVFIVVFLVLTVSNQGKPFFFQKRPGKNEKPFHIIKFKSMNDKKDSHGELLPFDQRVTKMGDFIRKYSLDEIPQHLMCLKAI